MTNKTRAHTATTRPTPAERKAAGRAQRKAGERDGLGRAPKPGDDGRDPLAWLHASNKGRVPELGPLRHGRMREDPLAFYRGAASLMANDLAALPNSGVMTQLCGDAHLSNFGFFASPERTLVFDITDFDETLPGPFEWDLRRLATSFVIASRERGFKSRTGSDAVGELTQAYRDHIRRFARMDTLEAWYWRLSSQTLLKLGSNDEDELAVIRKARSNTSRMFAIEATEKGKGGGLVIRDEPPFVYHDARATRRELRRFRERLPVFMAQYRASLAPERRVLLDRYELHDVAVLTPGVGSVGRRVLLLLMVADGRHPLFLQCKEVRASVLEAHLGDSTTAHAGQRVVEGQRLMQAASDIFLGWAGAAGGQTYCVRQLRDMKASYQLEDFSASDLREYAQACGYGLARAHARGGDAWTLAGYLGRSTKFDTSLAEFSEAYADVNHADWKRLCRAIDAGILKAVDDPDDDG